MNDHRLIRCGDGKWTPRHAASEHQASRDYIDAALRQTTWPCVVVTHHAPSIKSVADYYRHDELTAAFASDCDEIAQRAALWVHGHVHIHNDYMLGNCRVVSNPRGYVSMNEARGFDSAFVVEVGP